MSFRPSTFTVNTYMLGDPLRRPAGFYVSNRLIDIDLAHSLSPRPNYALNGQTRPIVLGQGDRWSGIFLCCVKIPHHRFGWFLMIGEGVLVATHLAAQTPVRRPFGAIDARSRTELDGD